MKQPISIQQRALPQGRITRSRIRRVGRTRRTGEESDYRDAHPNCAEASITVAFMIKHNSLIILGLTPLTIAKWAELGARAHLDTAPV